MPDWNSLLNEVEAVGTTYDLTRRKYLQDLSDYTGRNAIVYYSAWLQKDNLRQQGVTGFEVNDLDKNGLMSTIYQLDKSKGLDLLLHTPGGDTAATESLVDYLRNMFGLDVRAIVPQLALSAGTMIALSCNQIVMGKHSSLGPIDPQIAGVPAHAIVEEWERAHAEAKADPVKGALWQSILNKYRPGFIGAAEKAIEWSNEIAAEWLRTGMFKDREDIEECIQRVMDVLASNTATKAHNRHISAERAKDLGLDIAMLEEDQQLQERVLTVHHACMLTLSSTPMIKLIENQNGIAYTQVVELAS